MARKVFFSFYYAGDGWRASQVRNMGALEEMLPVRTMTGKLLKEAATRLLRNGSPSSWSADHAPWS